MCGIFGYISSKPKDCIKILPNLEKIRKLLDHRGPDSFGIKFLEEDNLILVHTRLSIIDLSENANQPMTNEDGTIWLVFNGEFYSYKDYVNMLMQKGHYFKSKSDSEVIIHLYEEYGPDFIKHIRGMFALGLWDKKKSELILARDRVGKKPLYYSYKNGIFTFASELKALVSLQHISKTICPDALNLYFAFGYIPGEYSIFKDIKKLKPGEILYFRHGEINIERYFNIYPKIQNISFEDASEQLYELLKESVTLRMVSDVPVGVLLSGGIDSGTIACLASQIKKTIKTFSIGFSEEKYNELPYARTIANYIKSDHYEYIVNLKDINIISKLAWFFDEPFADSSSLATYLVSEMAREKVKVVLSGDGGDELFGGYNWYIWVLSSIYWSDKLKFIRHILNNFSRIYPVNFKGKKFLETLNKNPATIYINRVSIFDEDSRKELLINILSDIKEFNQPETLVFEYFKNIESLLMGMRYFDFKFYLPEDILTKVDRSSMAVSLEVRAPLLDHKICEFAFSLPEDYIIKKGIKKYIFKKVAKKILPPTFEYERKHGFNIPVDEWFHDDLGAFLREELQNIKTAKIINTNYVLKLLNEHIKGYQKNGNKLWSLLMFLMWIKNYL